MKHCLLLTATLCSVAVLSASELSLVRGGSSIYSIAVEHDADPAEITAAEELQDFIARISGAELPIVRSDAVAAGPAIRVYRDPSLPHDAVAMKTDGEDLLLSGGGKRGTLYAVYTFLEDELGVRFWAPHDTFIPEKPDLTLRELDLSYVPPFEVREVSSEIFIADPVFAARRKINGHWEFIPEEYGGHESLLGWCHTFEELMPPERYFDAHPEWYSELDSRRVPHSQLCLSNPEMRREFIANVLALLEANPETRVISVSQNDSAGDNSCGCAECLALDARYGSKQSGILLDFVNEVADAVTQCFPDTLVETLAYHYTISAPTGIVPRDNVMIRLCSSANNILLAVEDENNSTMRQALREWAPITRQLAIWHYAANFALYMGPYPNWLHLAVDLRSFRDHKATWIFEQAGSGYDDLAELRSWLLSKLLWNPDLDQDALIDEFLTGYYGAAAPYIREYLEVIHREAFRSGVPSLGMAEYDTERWLSFDGVKELVALMDAAEAAVAGDPRCRANVTAEKAAIYYTYLMRPEATAPEASEAEYRRIGLELLRLTAVQPDAPYREQIGFASQYRNLQMLLGEASFQADWLPDSLRAIPPSQVMVFTAGDLMLYHRGTEVFVEADPHSPTGESARMLAGQEDWLIQQRLHPSIAVLYDSVDVFACVRGDSAPGCSPDDLPAVRLAVYSPNRQDDAGAVVLTARELAGDEYRLVKVGTYREAGDYFYVSSLMNPAVENIFVDRVILVGQK